MKIASLLRFAALIITQLGLIQQSLFAQGLAAQPYVLADTAQAYWRLQADQQHATPRVQFFNRYHQLLYQEQLPESSPTLTRRMRRAFDVLLSNLTTNRILATAYLAPLEDRQLVEPAPTVNSDVPLKQIMYKKGRALFNVQPSVNQLGKLILHFSQAKHRLVCIRLVNVNRSLTYYEDCSKQALYHRQLDLSGLPSGTYQLVIHGYARPFGYRLTIDRAVNRYYLQTEAERL